LKPDISRFFIDFFLDSENVFGVPESISNLCAGMGDGVATYCYGEESIKIFREKFTEAVLSQIVDTGVSFDSVAYLDDVSVEAFDFADTAIYAVGSQIGKVRDDGIRTRGGAGTWPSGFDFSTTLSIPKKWMLENRELAITNFLNRLSVFTGGYWTMGGNLAVAQDGASSLPQSYRESGVQLFFSEEFNPDGWEYFWKNFLDIYDTSMDKPFPPFALQNHSGSNNQGPLKSDWTKPCPKDLSQPEREEQCVSFQEALHGTVELERLQAFKNKIDPYQIFNCFNCINGTGEPLTPAPTPEPTTLSPTRNPVRPPTQIPVRPPTRSPVNPPTLPPVRPVSPPILTPANPPNRIPTPSPTRKMGKKGKKSKQMMMM
jgi:hypothetical protein